MKYLRYLSLLLFMTIASSLIGQDGGRPVWRFGFTGSALRMGLSSDYAIFIDGVDFAIDAQSAPGWFYQAGLTAEREWDRKWTLGFGLHYQQQGFSEEREGGRIVISGSERWTIHGLSLPVYGLLRMGRRAIGGYVRTTLTPLVRLTHTADIVMPGIAPRSFLLDADVELGLDVRLADKYTLRLGGVLFGASLNTIDSGGGYRSLYQGVRIQGGDILLKPKNRRTEKCKTEEVRGDQATWHGRPYL